jgi:hypothetical protein
MENLELQGLIALVKIGPAKKKTEGKMESRLLEDFQSPVGRLNCKSKIQK